MWTSWQLGPILRGIRGHRAAALLVVLQLGIGLALSVIAVLVADYMNGSSGLPSGLAEDELTLVELRVPGRVAGAAGTARRRAELLEEARRVPGCEGVATVGQLPRDVFERGPDEVRRSPGDVPVLAYELEAGAGIAAATGLRLRAGRDFTDADLRAEVTAAIVSPTFAAALWPGEDPTGMTFHSRSHGRAVVVGVADEMRIHLSGWSAANVIYAHVDPGPPRIVALVRSAPGRAAAVRAHLPDLRRAGEVLTVRPLDVHARRMSRTVDSVLTILGIMVTSIVLVVVIGSMGLTYYLVATRTPEIGLRRALGARRRDVVRHFMLESALFTVAGTIVGLAIVALVLPALAREQQGFAVSWPLVAIVAAAVAALNLVATFIPARRAAAVAPVVAAGNE